MVGIIRKSKKNPSLPSAPLGAGLAREGSGIGHQASTCRLLRRGLTQINTARKSVVKKQCQSV